MWALQLIRGRSRVLLWTSSQLVLWIEGALVAGSQQALGVKPQLMLTERKWWILRSLWEPHQSTASKAHSSLRYNTNGDTISKYQRHSHCYHLLLCWVPTLYIETASSFLTTAFKHLPLNVLQPPLWFTSEEIWNKQYIHLFYVLANCFLNS